VQPVPSERALATQDAEQVARLDLHKLAGGRQQEVQRLEGDAFAVSRHLFPDDSWSSRFSRVIPVDHARHQPTEARVQVQVDTGRLKLEGYWRQDVDLASLEGVE
jgi:hypothetical protein